MNLSITGKNSFIGNYYSQVFNKQPIKEIDLINQNIDSISFNAIDTLLHLSALVHQMKGAPEIEYYKVNSDLAYQTAKKAKQDGVLHFIYMSTVKVYGEYTESGLAWNEKSLCQPTDPYGKSKLEGEQRIKELEDNNFVVSIIRTPIVYGPGVKANMLNLMKLINRYPFIPLGNIDNQRSMTFVGNLCQLINLIVEQKKGGIFLASDENPVSTSQLVKEISFAFGKKNNILPIPSLLQQIIKKFKPAIYQRLFGNLVVDNQLTRKELGFNPQYTFTQGINEMVEWYKANR